MRDFPFGAVYVIEQDYSDEEIRRDLSNMRDCGFDLVTLWPVANAWLAKSSHEWVYDATKKTLDVCAALGMRAILQLFGQNQAQEFMPDAALTAEMEDSDELGGPVYENCFWANLNHPTVRAYFDAYFASAIGTLKDHPALYAWDVFNEAHFRSDDPWTVRKYQEWLQAKYGSIQRLNRDWYRRYEAFSQIRPEKRRAAYSIWSSLLPAIEYEKFRSENLTEICRFLYDTAKNYDGDHPVIVDGTSSQILAETTVMRNNDEFETAYACDMYGATFYPKSWGRDYRDTPWTLAMYFSIPAGAARKAGKPYLVNELQTHTQSALTPGSEVSPTELRNWIWMCLFNAPAAIQLWRWRPFLHGYQATGRGLTRMDGSPNERSAAAAKVVEHIRREKRLFSDFAVSPPTVRFAFSYGARLYFDALLKWQKSFWARDLEGWYKLFWRQGLSIGCTNLERFDESDFAAPITVLPAMVRVTGEEARRLTEYVERGGILIADGRMGTLDGKAAVPPEGVPGAALSDLFGFTEVDVRSGRSFSVDGRPVPAAFLSQDLELRPGAEVVARMDDGTPAVVRNRRGAGSTLYFNSFVGLALLDEAIPEIEGLVMGLLAGRPVIRAGKGDKVHLACVESAERKGMLLINFDREPQRVAVRGLPVGAAIDNVMTGERLAAGETTEFTLPADACYVYAWDAR